MSYGITIGKNKMKYIQMILFCASFNLIYILIDVSIAKTCGNLGRWIAFFSYLLIYIFYIFMIKSIKKVVLISVFSIWQVTIICELIYKVLGLEYAVFELLYTFDFILIVVLIFTIKQNSKRLINDWLVRFIIIILLFGTISTIINGIYIIDYLNAVRHCIRFLSIYYVFKLYYVENKTMYKCYKYTFILSVIFLLFSVILKIYQDYLNGIWGLRGQFIMTASIYIGIGFALIYFINNILSSYRFISLLLISIVCLGLMENTAGLLILLALTAIFLLILKGGKILKKIMMGILVFFSLGKGYEFLKSYYQKDYLPSLIDLPNYLIKFLLGNSNLNYEFGRFQAMNNIFNVENSNIFTKMFGRGFGSSLPPELWRYYGETLLYKPYPYSNIRGESIFGVYKFSEIFTKYGYKYGYHLSSFNSIVIDLGIIGVVIFFIGWIILTTRCFQLYKRTNDIFNKAMAISGIMVSYLLIYNITYGNMLWHGESMMLMFAFYGIIEQRLIYTKSMSYKNSI